MPLIDSHDRRIDYLRISITDRCNLSCAYCAPRSRVRNLAHPDILRYEEILRLVSLAARLGITHVRVTGGEPLVRRDVVPFLTSLRNIAGITDVSLTTNGVYLADCADDIRRAGVGRLNVSLDTLRPERFAGITGKDCWDAVWRGIETAARSGFHPLKINMVPVRGTNDDEIAAFARLTIDRDIHVRFIEFMPIGAGDRWTRDICVSTGEAQRIISEQVGPFEPLPRSEGTGPARNFRLHGARGVIGFISPLTNHFCGACRRLRLTADGRIRPCLLSDTEIDLKSPLRSGCDDAELERLLRLSLQIKPERHQLSLSVPSQAGRVRRTMSRIGG